MLEELDKAAADLANKKAGWVFRRDAAELFGQAAAKSLAALRAHEDDADVDVRGAVARALGTASAGLTGIAPEASPTAYSIKELARACEKPGKRTVEPSGEGYVVDVAVKGARTQKVYLMPDKGENGIETIRIFTVCGPPKPEALGWALRTNMKLALCGFAIMDWQGEEQLVLTDCYLAEHVSPKEIRAAVKEAAAYGDWIEHKLTGADAR
ncbi:MAG TPA: hypothetical protein PLO37_09845 [Candidatus Hydrogenedentes bacterium]|nr:hypothetical protein [Candidatus Hydrogenedentota bacterium]HPG67135.1 hypothetical protein [Candidatus Hydrogenedentota bacterium]